MNTPSPKGPGSNQWKDKPPVAGPVTPPAAGQQQQTSHAASQSPWGTTPTLGQRVAVLLDGLPTNDNGQVQVTRDEAEMILAGVVGRTPTDEETSKVVAELTADPSVELVGPASPSTPAPASPPDVDLPAPSAVDQARFAFLDQAQTSAAAAGPVTSLRKVRKEIVGEPAAGLPGELHQVAADTTGIIDHLRSSAKALQPQEGLSKAEQTQRLQQAAQAARQAAEQALQVAQEGFRVAARLDQAAQHAAQRDLDQHLADKAKAGPGAVASLADDGTYVTPDQIGDDLAGWYAQQQASNLDDDLQTLLDNPDPGPPPA